MPAWFLEHWSWFAFAVGALGGAFIGTILLASFTLEAREDAWDDGFEAGARVVRAAERDAAAEETGSRKP